jgi:hypothetical protein
VVGADAGLAPGNVQRRLSCALGYPQHIGGTSPGGDLRRHRAKDTSAHDLAYQRVECTAAATGPLGTCAEYLFETVRHLEELGVEDRVLERMRRSLIERVKVNSAGQQERPLADN